MKKTIPKVSVIIPSYNHAHYVVHSIESIVNQSYDNIELIVIDDGSSDSSPKLIKELSVKYNFIFVHRSNRGLSATLNEGLILSTGDYICICASDDKFRLDRISKQVNFMNDNPDIGMSYGKVIVIDEEEKENALDIKNSKSGWIFDDLIINRFHIPAVTTMIRRSVFEAVGNFDESLWVEDWDMWLRISYKFKVGFQNEFLTYYRQHDTNMSSNGLKLYESKVGALKKWKNLDNYDEIMQIWRVKWFRSLSGNYKKEAKKYLSYAYKDFFNINSIIGLIKYYFMKEPNHDK